MFRQSVECLQEYKINYILHLDFRNLFCLNINLLYLFSSVSQALWAMGGARTLSPHRCGRSLISKAVTVTISQNGVLAGVGQSRKGGGTTGFMFPLFSEW